MCSPTCETHIRSDMCFPTRKTHIRSYMWEYVCSHTWETYSLSDMCSITQETHFTSLNFLGGGRGTHVPGDKNVNLSSSTSPLAFYNVPPLGMHVIYAFCIVTLFTFFTGPRTGKHLWKVL